MNNTNLNTHHAIKPDTSAWVSAHAGSGKTYTLISRMVGLLVNKNAPEKILCLTYTRNAAAEMQSRLFDLLGTWARLDDGELKSAVTKRLGQDIADDDLPYIRALFIRALETPGGLRIETIHSFCAAVLARFPLEAGLTPQFITLDERGAKQFQNQIINDILRQNHDGELLNATHKLMRQLSEDDFLRLTEFIIRQHAHFTNSDRAARLASLRAEIKCPHDAEAMLPKNMGRLVDAIRASHVLTPMQNSDKSTTQRRAGHLARAFNAASDNQLESAWESLARVFLDSKHQPAKTLITKDLEHLREQFAQWQAQFMGIEITRRNLHMLAMTEAVMVLAHALIARYGALKRRHNALDFDDLIIHTKSLLDMKQGAHWVLFKIDGGIDHILVDEAQDTSPPQWEIIAALADAFFDDHNNRARTIFAVGDAKQSIFSFQGAEPARFAAMRAHFAAKIAHAEQDFHPLNLDMSRRSTSEVLKIVDMVFAQEMAKPGVWTQSEALIHKVHREGAQGYVELLPPATYDAPANSDEPQLLPKTVVENTPRQQTANAIAAKIAAWQTDSTHNIKLSDILILVRKRDAFVVDMLRALKAEGIAVAGADRMIMLDQIVIQDLIRAAEFALFPEDNLALAITLRSPLGGISEDELFALAYQRKGSLWQAVQAAVAKSNPAPMLVAAHERLTWLLAHADLLTPFDYFAQFLSAHGAHKLLTARLGDEITDPIDEFLRLALSFERQAPASLQGFLHWLKAGKSEIKRDLEQNIDAVRIMTVHGAKGLEAPIVFLPDTCGKDEGSPQNRDQMLVDNALSMLVWRSRTGMMTPHQTVLAEAAKAGAADESHRLLYVALTRARDRLYISGYLGKRDKAPPSNSWYSYIQSAMATSATQSEGAWHFGREAPLGDSGESPPVAIIIPPAPAWLTRKAPPAPDLKRWHLPSQLSAAPKSEFIASAAQQAMDYGTRVHRLLECLPDLPRAQWAQAAQNYLARFYDDDGICDKIIAQVFAVLEHDELAPLFAPHARAEVSLVGEIDIGGAKRRVMGQIDRMVETDDAVIIIDFKSGAPAPDKPAYIRQMAAYRALIRQTTSLRVRSALVWTQNAQITWLADATLDVALDAVEAHLDLADKTI